MHQLRSFRCTRFPYTISENGVKFIQIECIIPPLFDGQAIYIFDTWFKVRKQKNFVFHNIYVMYLALCAKIWPKNTLLLLPKSDLKE